MKIFDEIESEVQSYARNFPRILIGRRESSYMTKMEMNIWTFWPVPVL